MATTPIEEKIALLLKKAESTDSPHEAEALSEAAEKLMIKHGIELSMLDMSHDKKEAIVKLDYHRTGTYAMELAEQGMSIAKALKLQAFYIDNRRYGAYVNGKVVKGVKVLVIGHESDVRAALLLIDSLAAQSVIAAKVWAKSGIANWMTPSEKYVARRSFLAAFGVGAGNRIRENRNHIVREEFPTGTDLVLVDRAKQVEDWVADNLKTHTVQNRRNVDLYGASAGAAAGRDAATGERGLTQGRALTA